MRLTDDLAEFPFILVKKFRLSGLRVGIQELGAHLENFLKHRFVKLNLLSTFLGFLVASLQGNLDSPLDRENVASVAMTQNSTTLTMSTSSLTGGRRGSSMAEAETLCEGKSTAQSKVAQSSSGMDLVVVNEKADVEQAEIRKELLDLTSPPSEICEVFKYSANEPRKDPRIPLEA